MLNAVKAENALNQALAEILKVGDTVKIFSGNSIKIAKINKKTLICESGIKWDFSEVHLPDSRSLEWREKAKEILFRNG